MKLSIITINFNNAAGLEKTIRSVIEQDYDNFEYIVIDGGSSDTSTDIIKQYAVRIKYCVSEPDKGIYDAMNKGIRASAGEYCLFLNSGDVLASKNILQLIFSKHHTADILYGNMLINYGKNKIRIGKMPKKLTLVHLLGDTLWHPVSFIRRSLFTHYGLYDEQFRYVADYDFFLRILIIEKVKSEHLGFIISIFDTTGVSSNPQNRENIKNERKLSQEKYFSQSTIENGLKKYNRFLKLNRILLKIGLR